MSSAEQFIPSLFELYGSAKAFSQMNFKWLKFSCNGISQCFAENLFLHKKPARNQHRKKKSREKNEFHKMFTKGKAFYLYFSISLLKNLLCVVFFVDTQIKKN